MPKVRQELKEHFDALEEFDDAITRQFERLIRLREEARLVGEERREQGQERGGSTKIAPQMTSNIQTVPPRGGNKQLEKVAQQVTKGPETSGSDEWFKVVRRDREAKTRRPTGRQITELLGPAETPRIEERRRYPRGRRPPRTAAVALKAVDESATYAQILKAARDKVSLKDLGISSPRIRNQRGSNYRDLGRGRPSKGG